MKPPLTVHILTKDNGDTIIPCLEGLSQINCHLLVGDLGSRDETIGICGSFGAKIERLSLNDDFAKARNHLLSKADTPWHLMLEPWENMVSGLESLVEAVCGPPASYRFSIFENDIMSKSTRLWHRSLGLKWENPVYSSLPGSAFDLPVVLTSLPHQSAYDIDDLICKWQDRCPLSSEPVYYRSCIELKSKNWDAFLNYAELYLHQEKKPKMAYIMTSYYMAMVYTYIKKDGQKAVNALIPCLTQQPTMAEFWCLLGDIYYAASDYKRAYEFYQNAQLLGQRRKNNTEWPMEISKYKEYPEKMMQSCLKLNQSARAYVRQS